MLKSNNIYNNLLDVNNELSDDEQMIFEIDLDETNESNESKSIDKKFNEIIGYEKKKYLDLIRELEIYKNFNNLYKFKNFIVNLKDDYRIENYSMREKIFYLLKKNVQIKKINYKNLLEDKYDCYNYIEKILLLSNEEIIFLIEKYNDIYLDNSILPIDPTTNFIVDSSNKFNLSFEIIKFLIHKNDKKILVDINLLESIIKKISNPDRLILDIINKLYVQYNIFEDKIRKLIHENITLKLNTNINELISNEIISNEFTFTDICNIIIFKLILENYNFDKFENILKLLYLSSNILFLEIISILKPELLDITLSQLQKIIYYGKYQVFMFLMEYIPWKIVNILKESNPFDLIETNIYKDETCCYESDDENAHKKIFEYILMIAKEKNFIHIYWSDEIKKQWIDLAIRYKHIKYNELLQIFNLSFDFSDKESIKSHVKFFGRETTWRYLLDKYKDKDFILDILIS